MTTSHGLMTISELFAGFNLINTGVVNCLIMCQNARKVHHSETKNPKQFLGRGTAPSPDPSPFGRRHAPLPKPQVWVDMWPSASYKESGLLNLKKINKLYRPDGICYTIRYRLTCAKQLIWLSLPYGSWKFNRNNKTKKEERKPITVSRNRRQCRDCVSAG